MNDLEAFGLMKEGDPAGLKLLFDSYYPSLCGFAKTYVSSPDVAKDLISEFFIKLWQDREKISIQKSVKSFFFRSIKNTSLNYLRSQKGEMMDFQSYHEVLVSTELSPQEQLEFQEFQNDLDSFTQSLPDRRKLILNLKIKEGMSNEEIADTLMISESTVKNQLREAMLSIKSKYKTLK